MTILKILLFVYMVVMIVFSFVTPPPIVGQDWAPASRIFYYHVPFAFVSFIAFAHAMVQSILYLKRKDPIADNKAAMAAGLGLIFCFAATVSGSIFAKVAWGVFWNWDPRQTSILILLVIYGAYFALRQSIAQPERRASFSAVYSILAFVTVPFLGFIVPRIYQSLHPEDTFVAKGQLNIGGYEAFIFLSSLFCFLCTYFWLHSIGNRVQKLEQKQLEDSYEFERA